MRIRLSFSALKRIKAHEYATRFVLGGGLTVLTGWIASRYGPVIGGLFLGFPVIFPAGDTLLEKHEREKKQCAGIPRTIRGRLAAAIDARGAALGSVGMGAFALLAWKLLPHYPLGWILLGALALWLLVSVVAWRTREKSIDLLAWLRRRGHS
jgi:hypothetical protein